jgi:uncharacterized protein (DUF934 family)
MVLVKGGQAVADAWSHFEDDAPLPEGDPVTISWKRWTTERDMLEGRNAPLGIRLPHDVAAAELGPDANRFGLIVLNFPAFTDGRAFSQARVLRGRFAYKGELRAGGQVIRDQLQFMQRCGIDSFEVDDRALTEDWFAALTEFDLFYQAAEDNRPWIARQRLGSS